MDNQYQDFFNKAKRNKHPLSKELGGPKQLSSASKGKFNMADGMDKKTDSREDTLKKLINKKKRAANKKKRKKDGPIIKTLIGVSIVLGIISAVGLYDPGLIFNKISIGMFSAASAKNKAKPATPKVDKKEKSAEPQAAVKKSEKLDLKNWTDQELSYFSKLNDRKIELDAREVEITRLEEELHKQKLDLESRIQKLKGLRREISSVLKEKVLIDKKKVTKLIDFYSNMKPKKAAEIIGTLNEDLAVEVLGGMKKKNAADILNLLKPAKARKLSEKFAGYRRY